MSMSKTRSVRAGRRVSAEARQAVYDKLTLQQKLDSLPKDGAKKQRAKLEAALAALHTKQQATADEPVKVKKVSQKKVNE